VTPVDTDLLVPPLHVGFAASPFVVFVLGLLVPGAGLAVMVGRMLAARAWQKRVERAQTLEVEVLAAGPQVLVGEVVVDEGDAPEPGVAIRVASVQQVFGREVRELERKTSAGPFYLRTASGEHVRIEPGASPVLASELEPQPFEPGRFLRTRFAKLRSGERAIVAGSLRRGFNPRGAGTYRAAEGGWVLAPGRGESLWVSGSALGSVFAKKSRFFAAYAAAFALWLVAAQVLFAPFYRLAGAEPERCVVGGLVTDHVLHRNPAYVTGKCSDGPPLSETARPGLVELVEANGTSGVVLSRVRSGGLTMLGPVPTVSYVRLGALLVIGLFAFAVARAVSGTSSKAWYERRRFVEPL
jgi:hypothetical protein